MKPLLTFLIILSSLSVFSQVTDLVLQHKIDSIEKFELIYLNKETIKVTRTTSASGSTPGNSPTSKSINFDFHVGADSPFKSIETAQAKNLEKIIMKDPEAYAEFKNAMVHLKKHRTNEIFKFVSYAGIVVCIFPFAGSMSELGENGVTGKTAASGAGILISFIGTIVFEKAANKHMDGWANSIVKSVQIYNENLIKNIK